MANNVCNVTVKMAFDDTGLMLFARGMEVLELAAQLMSRDDMIAEIKRAQGTFAKASEHLKPAIKQD
jgi:hypothetical protein